MDTSAAQATTDPELRLALAMSCISYSKDAIVRTFTEMIQERIEQFDQSDHNQKIEHQLHGYVMALEDAFYRLYGAELDYGQDSAPELAERPF